jgi:hypothetical protein
VYNGDFAGFRKALSLLSQHEKFPHLLAALQLHDAQVRWGGFPWVVPAVPAVLQMQGCTSQLLPASAQQAKAAHVPPQYQEQLQVADQAGFILRLDSEGQPCCCLYACSPSNGNLLKACTHAAALYDGTLAAKVKCSCITCRTPPRMPYCLLQGMTIAHLLACSGRAEELQQLMDVLFRMQGDGVETIRRWVAT